MLMSPILHPPCVLIIIQRVWMANTVDFALWTGAL